MIPALINASILLLISAIHVYWVFGGRWGLNASLPELNSQKVFKPRWFDTLFVAIALAVAALFYLYKIGWFSSFQPLVPTWLGQYGLWALAGSFLLRAIGEFRYVGFFKRVRNSQFARLDTRYYSPLCVLLCVNTLLLTFLN